MTYDKCVYKMLSFYVKLHILFVTILSTLPTPFPGVRDSLVRKADLSLKIVLFSSVTGRRLQALLVLLTQFDIVD